MSDRQVFVDASFWIGRRNRRDSYHERCKVLGMELSNQRLLMVSTAFVFAEVHASFTRFPGLRQVVIRDFFDNPVMQYESPTVSDQWLALDILRMHRDKSYSFCDAISFVVMRRLGLKRVVTFDRHFEQFGGFEIIN